MSIAETIEALYTSKGVSDEDMTALLDALHVRGISCGTLHSVIGRRMDEMHGGYISTGEQAANAVARIFAFAIKTRHAMASIDETTEGHLRAQIKAVTLGFYGIGAFLPDLRHIAGLSPDEMWEEAPPHTRRALIQGLIYTKNILATWEEIDEEFVRIEWEDDHA